MTQLHDCMSDGPSACYGGVPLAIEACLREPALMLLGAMTQIWGWAGNLPLHPFHCHSNRPEESALG